jgi:hypothetical protein
MDLKGSSLAGKPAFIAYVPKNNQASDGTPKTTWREIGAAWATRNGGLSVGLAANPEDGRFVLLPPEAKAEGVAEAQ